MAELRKVFHFESFLYLRWRRIKGRIPLKQIAKSLNNQRSLAGVDQDWLEYFTFTFHKKNNSSLGRTDLSTT